jgi:hypothetical protein
MITPPLLMPLSMIIDISHAIFITPAIIAIADYFAISLSLLPCHFDAATIITADIFDLPFSMPAFAAMPLPQLTAPLLIRHAADAIARDITPLLPFSSPFH